MLFHTLPSFGQTDSAKRPHTIVVADYVRHFLPAPAADGVMASLRTKPAAPLLPVDDNSGERSVRELGLFTRRLIVTCEAEHQNRFRDKVPLSDYELQHPAALNGHPYPGGSVLRSPVLITGDQAEMPDGIGLGFEVYEDHLNAMA